MLKNFMKNANSCTALIQSKEWKKFLGDAPQTLLVLGVGLKHYSETVVLLYSLGTSVISGLKDGKCVVNTTRDLGNNEITQSYCEYSPNSLAVFTDKILEDLSGNATVFISNEYDEGIINRDKIIGAINTVQVISAQECKVLKNTRIHNVPKIQGTVSF
jgi:hypothetical protein